MSIERIQEVINQESNLSTVIVPKDIPDGDSLLQLKCNLYIHILLKEWEGTSDPPYMPDKFQEVKRNLCPLLVQLRKGALSENLFTSLASILYHLQQDEFTRAEQCYMDLSLGKVAWPIGVTSVGIHSGSSMLSSHVNRANVMKDEVTKDWIIQIKRLITFKRAMAEDESE
ncbi:mRNA splicing protein PRP18 Ecym_1447 [Eremothecium cymbalariae DBVPG|uniref:Pre-mRNA-splicing factor 18 n=1 Tax=Eremothecium cymbalariae (strain CBS 270.75 / DBVPG 7215 / KCTC 17166 / NRRL Y-17582) TaxID=931890 RepID=G8JMF6_ERECY|nr:hypothetical protein Ecym_1447 [Eremothecium cymbalariae DBVPG\